MAGADTVVTAPAVSFGEPWRERPMRTKLLAQLTHVDDEIAAGAEQAELAQQIDQSAKSHVGEQNLGGAAALLSGLVDLRCGHRFGERKLGIFHHHAPQQGHKQDAQHSAHQHQHRRLHVGVLKIKDRPRPGDDERRDGEDGARSNRLADRANRPRDVLFQQTSLASAAARPCR